MSVWWFLLWSHRPEQMHELHRRFPNLFYKVSNVTGRDVSLFVWYVGGQPLAAKYDESYFPCTLYWTSLPPRRMSRNTQLLKNEDGTRILWPRCRQQICSFGELRLLQEDYQCQDDWKSGTLYGNTITFDGVHEIMSMLDITESGLFFVIFSKANVTYNMFMTFNLNNVLLSVERNG